MTPGTASTDAATTALRDEGAAVELTRRHVCRLADAVRQELTARGVGKGDVVLVQVGNSWRFVALYLALRRLRAVTAPVPLGWRAPELGDATKATGAAWVVSSARRIRDLGARVAPAEPDDAVVLHATGQPAAAPVAGLRHPEPAGPDQAADDRATEPTEPPDPTEPVLLAHSVVESGTRWVAHTHRSADFGLASCAAAWGLSSASRILVGAQVGFLAGFQWGVRLGLHLGAAITLLPAWDARAAARAVDVHGCDFMYGTGRQLTELLDQLAAGTARDLVFALAASQPTEEVVRRAHEVGTTVVATYGQPESFLMATCRRADSVAVRGTTRGRALAGTSLGVRHHVATQDAPAWEEIVTTGPHVGRYLAESSSVNTKQVTGSTLATGEQGWLDESGHLHWVRSRARTIVRSGVVISPAEVVSLLRSCPGVLDVRVRAVASVRHGQEVLAELRVAAGVGDGDVTDFLRERDVARHRWPDRFELGVDPLGREYIMDTEGPGE